MFRGAPLTILFVLAALTGHVSSFSLHQNVPSRNSLTQLSLKSDKGCAAVPYNKKKVAVFGVGGYMGSTIFGFLQRASQIYGYGVKDGSFPRAIGASSIAGGELNKTLLRTFKLAFAGENLIRLTNMQDVDGIAERIREIDAVVLGTVYQLEQRPVTGGTYDKTPNCKTQEFYLDEKYAANPSPENDDLDFHLNLFQNSLDACKKADIKHVVVVETPATQSSKPFAQILDKAKIPFTYIRANGELVKTKIYTFEDGLQCDMNLEGFSLPEGFVEKVDYNAGDWSSSFEEETKKSKGDESNLIAREDLAAVAVQSLMTLDWTRSRCIAVSSNGSLASDSEEDDGVYKPPTILKSDKDWCINSGILAEKLTNID
mmetsp:Transcript_23847/g.36288  ORF Transcript_23847/g.36288 Transcript_23847/m.36288 type:complete len:372 (-) Transcript_23847:7-1122(-)